MGRLLRTGAGARPEYALAHAGLADSYAILGFYCIRPPTEAFRAARARHSGPARSIRHWRRRIPRWRTWRCITTGTGPARSGSSGRDRAQSGLRDRAPVVRKLSIDPGPVGWRPDQFQRGVALDPSARSGTPRWGGGTTSPGGTTALDQCRRAIEIDPELPVAHHWLALVSEELGDWDPAEAAMRRTVVLSGRDGGSLASLPMARGAAASRRPRAAGGAGAAPPDGLRVRLRFRDDPRRPGGDRLALEWLEQAYEERTHRMAFLLVDPRMDRLREQPRFEALLERMAFP